MAFEKGHALTIGVGSYQYMSQANIPISVSDAQSVSDLLCDQNLCAYLPQQVNLLHDKQASRANILEALDALASKTRPDDTVLLYYCGHGEYGTDGNYYLTTHDTRISGHKIMKGTGISEAELLDKLRPIPAKRLLLLFNACHSGEISPHLGLGETDKSFGNSNLPQRTVDALLSSGEGRIIISACRPTQKSWIGNGKLSIFTQALVDGLAGQGYVPNNSGYISAYGLYEHLYFAIKEAAEKLGHTQEPELTVLKGVGPFPVSLYRGATDLGMFDSEEAVPEGTATRQVDPARSQRLFKQIIKTVTVSASEGSVAAGGDIHGNVTIAGNQETSQTASGHHIAQASGGGSATVTDQSKSSSIFDQRGQEVGTQYNVAGDVKQPGSGDTFNMSGDFRGAMVNVKSTLSNVTHSITASSKIEPSLKTELKQLFKKLSQALAQAPPQRAEQVEAVSQAAEMLINTATAENPNKTMLQVSGEGLKQTARDMPNVLAIATQIVATVARS